MVGVQGTAVLTMKTRDLTLRKLQSTLDTKTAAVRDKGTSIADLGWDEIGFVCEGLAFAGRPLRQGTESVTKKYDLGPRGAWMLNLISNGLVYPLELSDIFQVGRSLITAELQRLTDAGLITSRPGETDRRRTELALTPEGEAASEQIRQDISTIVRRNLAAYSAEDVIKFAMMLRDVRAGGVQDSTDAD